MEELRSYILYKFIGNLNGMVFIFAAWDLFEMNILCKGPMGNLTRFTVGITCFSPVRHTAAQMCITPDYFCLHGLTTAKVRSDGQTHVASHKKKR